MDEGQVKAAVLTRARQANGRRRKPIATAEFTLGSSGVRADLALFAESSIGFEIKTAKDTLRRLPTQMQAYARYFDHAVAVIAPCHIPHVRTGLLHGASLWTYDGKGDLQLLLEGQVNTVDDASLFDLMTNAERRNGDFRSVMAARYEATSIRFWSAVARRAIRGSDLTLLSRFNDIRQEARRLAAEREAQWERWRAAQEEFAISA